MHSKQTLRLYISFFLLSLLFIFSRCSLWGNQCLDAVDCPVHQICIQGWCKVDGFETSNIDAQNQDVPPEVKKSTPEQLCLSDATSEICNGLDDDCDGKIDNGLQERMCYDGPLNTSKTGSCRSGIQSCDSQKGKWSACDGQILPTSQDICADDDCNGTIDPQTTSCAWAHILPNADKWLHSITITDKGYLLFVGIHKAGTLTWKKRTFRFKHTSLFVLELNRSGQLRTVRILLPVLFDGGSLTPLTVQGDSSGRIAIAGFFRGRIQIGEKTYSTKGKKDAFVFKVDARGQIAWFATAGDLNNEQIQSLALTPNGELYVYGSFQHRTRVQGTTLEVKGGGQSDLWLAKLDTQGSWKWAVAFGGKFNDAISGWHTVAADSNGVFVTGGIQGKSDAVFGSKIVPWAHHYNNTYRAFIAKWTPKGKLAWVTLSEGQAGHFCDAMGQSLVLSSLGNVFVGGRFSGTECRLFGHVQPNISGHYDFFVARLSTREPKVSWIQTGGSLTNEELFSLHLDERGILFLLGNHQSTFTLDSFSLTNAGKEDLYLASLNNEGQWQSGRSFGGKGKELGLTMAIGGKGRKYIVGQFTGSTLLGTQSLQTFQSSSPSYFVWKVR